MAFKSKGRDNFLKNLFQDKLSNPEYAHFLVAYEEQKTEQNYRTSLILIVVGAIAMALLAMVDTYLIVSEIYAKKDGIYNLLAAHLILLGVLSFIGFLVYFKKKKSIVFKKKFYRFFVAIFSTWCIGMSMVELEGEKDTAVLLIGIATISIGIIFNRMERWITYGIITLLVIIVFYFSTADTSVLFANYVDGLSFLLLGVAVAAINSAFRRDLFLKEKIIEQQKETLENQNIKLANLVENIQESNTNLERFAAVAAHDLKAPIRTISELSKILNEKHSQHYDEEDKEIWEFIINDCETLKNLIEGLLKYSSTANAVYETAPVNLEKLVDGILKMIRISIKEADAEIIIENDLSIVAGQQSLIEQLFLNLVNNALKFRPKNKKPTIRISCENLENSFVKIGIKDNGIGIASKYHDSIFEVFKKLHRAKEYEGSGIGLATCKKIVEGFGGKIWVESVMGEGATFYFTLKSME